MRRGVAILRRFKPEDADWLKRRIDGWDMVEAAMHGIDPWDYVVQAHAKRPADPHWTMMDSLTHRPIAIGGIHRYAPRMGRVWMLETRDMRHYRQSWLCLARAMLDGYVPNYYDRLDNIVPVGKAPTILFLRRLGFAFGPAFVHTSGISVLPFWWERGRPEGQR